MTLSSRRRPRVSVVMPSYNHAAWVGEAISSVLAQTMGDLELVVVDDASSDDSREVIAGYRDPRMRVLGLSRNVGGAATLNRAILESRAELVAVLNSDDTWELNKLAAQLGALDENPELEAVFTHARLVDAVGMPFAPEAAPAWHDVFRQPNRSQAGWLRFFFDHGNALCHPSVLIRRRFYETHGLYDNRLRQLPDFERWIVLVKRAPIHILADTLVHFRLLGSGQNVSGITPTSVVRGFHEHLAVAAGFFDGCCDTLLREGFGDHLDEDDLATPDRRACAIAMLWFAVSGPLRDVARTHAHNELRRLLGSSSAATILAHRYNFTDLDLHALAGDLSPALPPTTGRWVENLESGLAG